MRRLPIFFVLVLAVLANEKKISLEDIERDYLASEKNSKEIKKPLPVTPRTPAGSPTQFGFVPVKSQPDYVQQEPKAHYLQQQVQYNVPPQYASQRYTSIYQRPSYYQYQANVPEETQHAKVQPQYYYQPQPSYDNNVQYIADNSIQTGQNGQQYYMQYVYLHPSPSNAIQTVVDPKGNLQYIMYVPTYVPQQSQNYETAVEYEKPPTQYEVTEEKYGQGKEDQYATIKQAFFKREPKSLLDSYVPSIVQYQYFKQQQAKANALRESDVKVAQSSTIDEYIQPPRETNKYKTYKISSTYKA